MTNCNHEWEKMQNQPLYRCVHCGYFLRVEK